MEPLLTIEDVSQLLKISVRAVNRLCRSGRLDHVSLSRKERRFLLEHVEQFIQSRVVSRAEPKRIDRSKADRVISAPKKSNMMGGGASSLTEGIGSLRKEIAELCR